MIESGVDKTMTGPVQQLEALGLSTLVNTQTKQPVIMNRKGLKEARGVMTASGGGVLVGGIILLFFFFSEAVGWPIPPDAYPGVAIVCALFAMAGVGGGIAGVAWQGRTVVPSNQKIIDNQTNVPIVKQGPVKEARGVLLAVGISLVILAFALLWYLLINIVGWPIPTSNYEIVAYLNGIIAIAVPGGALLAVGFKGRDLLEVFQKAQAGIRKAA